jgi:energy-coupling factor transporter ATP-binding protein EcfA2
VAQLADSTEAENKSSAAVTSASKFVNQQFASDLRVEQVGFEYVGPPRELIRKFDLVGYQCLPYLAVQIALCLNAERESIRALMLEGPSGCGKSFLAKSLAKISGAELMCLSCYNGMPTQNLVESPSTLALANAMAKGGAGEPSQLMNLGILSRAFLRSLERPVILLVDELDKPDTAIDTFFLGPIQDARIWLESRAPIDANPNNLLIIFTKNFNRTVDEALLRRCQPITMTYLDSTLERKILSPLCDPNLISNLVGVADRMRYGSASYRFDRPPAPEELLLAATYIVQLLEWGIFELRTIGHSVFGILAKSEHDRAVLEHMLRYHPDFLDPHSDPKDLTLDDVYERFGRVLLQTPLPI